MPGRLIHVGRIGAAHGVRGEVRLESYMQEPGALGRSGPLFDAAAHRTFDVKLLRQIKPGRFIARIRGVQSRQDAESLTNLDLYMDRAGLPDPAEDEFYYADLAGMRVEDRAGSEIGTITAVLHFGAGDILQIARNQGGELLLPFTRRVVLAVDLAQGKAVVEIPSETSAQSEGAAGQAA